MGKREKIVIYKNPSGGWRPPPPHPVDPLFSFFFSFVFPSSSRRRFVFRKRGVKMPEIRMNAKSKEERADNGPGGPPRSHPKKGENKRKKGKRRGDGRTTTTTIVHIEEMRRGGVSEVQGPRGDDDWPPLYIYYGRASIYASVHHHHHYDYDYYSDYQFPQMRKKRKNRFFPL
jgi:hypothetical protein